LRIGLIDMIRSHSREKADRQGDNQELKKSTFYIPEFLPFLLALVLTRLMSILTYAEVKVFDEDLYRGTIGLEIIDGLKLPFWDYRPDPYSGGPLVVGILASVFFRIFGPSLFALKLVPLCFDIAALWAVYLLMKQAFDARTAKISCALIIFAPSAYVQLSLTTMGFHSESACLSLWMVYFLSTYRYNREAHWRLVAFSLLAGLSIWFSMISSIAVLAALVYWVVSDYRSISLREVLIAAFFLVLGVLPAVFYDLAHHGATAVFISKFWPANSGSDVPPIPHLRNKSVILGISFTSMFAIETSTALFRALSGVPYVLAAGLPVLWLFSGRWRSAFASRGSELIWYFVIYVALFILIYLSVEGFAFEFGSLFPSHYIYFRYYYPLATFSLLLSGIGLAKLKKPVLILLPLLLLGLIGNGIIWARTPTIDVFRSVGYSYRQLGWVISESSLGDAFHTRQFIQLLKKYPVYKRRPIALGFFEEALSYNDFYQRLDTLDKGVELLSLYPAETRPWLIEVWARLLLSQKTVIPYDALSRELATFSQKEMDLFVKGLASRWSLDQYPNELLENDSAAAWYDGLTSQQQGWITFQQASALEQDIIRIEGTGNTKLPYFSIGNSRLEDILSSKHRKWFWRGIGYALSFYGISSSDVGREKALSIWADFLKSQDLAEIFWGIGWQIREMYLEDSVRANGLIQALPQKHIASATRGSRDFEEFYGLRKRH